MDINEVAGSVAMATLPQRRAAAPGTQTVSSDTVRPHDAQAPSQSVQTQPVSFSDPSIRDKDWFGNELDTAIEKIQQFVNTAASDIKFSIDEDSGRTVVKVIDRETQDVIRQIPSQEILDLAQALGKLQGLLIKQKA
jgi:flagellar protein FlaG